MKTGMHWRRQRVLEGGKVAAEIEPVATKSDDGGATRVRDTPAPAPAEVSATGVAGAALALEEAARVDAPELAEGGVVLGHVEGYAATVGAHVPVGGPRVAPAKIVFGGSRAEEKNHVMTFFPLFTFCAFFWLHRVFDRDTSSPCTEAGEHCQRNGLYLFKLVSCFACSNLIQDHCRSPLNIKSSEVNASSPPHLSSLSSFRGGTSVVVVLCDRQNS